MNAVAAKPKCERSSRWSAVLFRALTVQGRNPEVGYPMPKSPKWHRPEAGGIVRPQAEDDQDRSGAPTTKSNQVSEWRDAINP